MSFVPELKRRNVFRELWMVMPTLHRSGLSDLRGAARMAVDATTGVVDLVESMHRTIQLRPGPLGRSVAGGTQGITGLVYGSVRGVTRLVGRGLDAALAPVASLLPEGEPRPARDQFAAVINGIYGDYLARTGNPLAIDMSLRDNGQVVDLENPAGVLRGRGDRPSEKLLVLVHGLCLNDLSWRRQGHDAALASEFGFTALHLRYNSGLRIADNGRAFSAVLEELVANWPRPVNELVIIGHSMGGLIVRGACHYGKEAGHGWLQPLRKLFFLATPHHGAPLERGGQWLDSVLDLSPYAAPFTRIGRARSAGIIDLGHGSITDDPEEFVPLPPGVKSYAAAASLGAKPSLLGDRLVGDGLVPVDSALGRHAEAGRTLAIARRRQWVGVEMGHLELLGRPQVHARLRAWLQETD